MSSALETAETALRQMQEFEPSSLPRKEQLGSLALDEAVPPAEKLVKLYSLIPASMLRELPDNQLQHLAGNAQRSYARLERLQQFDLNSLGGRPPGEVRQELIAGLDQEYADAFSQLFPLIAFVGSRTLDFGRVETEAREVIKTVRAESQKIVGDLEATAKSAGSILDEVRRVAAEQGVSQQAIYFKNTADEHETTAAEWAKYTLLTGIGLGGYALLTIFSHKIDFLKPANSFEAAQLIVGKVLLFGVVAYLLVLCARNFLANRHNAIVNRHRQNALVTFQNLADAAEGDGHRDIVLAHAAACVFAPQETGFSRSGTHMGSPPTLIELLPKILPTGSPATS